ncbi:MAG: DNA helicase UvrD, partial [Clostridia bacterium]|nr:DNA helicase UvrD [Clostridia bacterium]
SPKYPSRFILDIDPELLDLTHEPDENLIKDTRRYIELSKMLLAAPTAAEFVFTPGTRIKHSIFGQGEILEYEETDNTYLIQFDGLSTPRRLNARVKLETL